MWNPQLFLFLLVHCNLFYVTIKIITLGPAQSPCLPLYPFSLICTPIHSLQFCGTNFSGNMHMITNIHLCVCGNGFQMQISGLCTNCLGKQLCRSLSRIFIKAVHKYIICNLSLDYFILSNGFKYDWYTEDKLYF